MARTASTASRSSSRRAIAAALLLVTVNAMADVEARYGQDWVRITTRPCTNAAVLAQLPPGAVPDLRQAEAEFQGVRYAPCWRANGNAVHLLYEDGDEGLLPASTLRQVLLV